MDTIQLKDVALPSLESGHHAKIRGLIMGIKSRVNAALNLVPLAQALNASGQSLSEAIESMELKEIEEALEASEGELFTFKPHDYIEYATRMPSRPHNEVVASVLEEEFEELHRCVKVYLSSSTQAKSAHYSGVSRWATSIQIKLLAAQAIGISTTQWEEKLKITEFIDQSTVRKWKEKLEDKGHFVQPLDQVA